MRFSGHSGDDRGALHPRGLQSGREFGQAVAGGKRSRSARPRAPTSSPPTASAANAGSAVIATRESAPRVGPATLVGRFRRQIVTLSYTDIDRTQAM